MTTTLPPPRRCMCGRATASAAHSTAHLRKVTMNDTRYGTTGKRREDDRLTTGSSIMPQKKNADAAELIRARSARGIGAVTAILALLKGLPLAYDRDLQEDRAALYEAFDVARDGSIWVLDRLKHDARCAKPCKNRRCVMKQRSSAGWKRHTAACGSITSKFDWQTVPLAL